MVERISEEPGLFFTMTPADDGGPGAVDVDAHPAGPFPAGVMLCHTDPRWRRVDHDARVGALRWSTRTGAVSEVYVPPRWRRQGVATAILRACENFAQAGALAPPTASGARTALGHAWLCTVGQPDLPGMWALPMTPAADAEGADARLLLPDDPAALTAALRAHRPPGVTDEELADLADRACGPANGVRLSQYRRG